MATPSQLLGPRQAKIALAVMVVVSDICYSPLMYIGIHNTIHKHHNQILGIYMDTLLLKSHDRNFVATTS